MGKNFKRKKEGKEEERKKRKAKQGKAKARVRWVQFDAAQQYRTEPSKPLYRTELPIIQSRADHR